MRFVVHMHFDKDNNILLPPWYRIGFASMIKEALRQADATSKLYELYYGNAKKNRPKPFTFAVKLNISGVEKSTVNYLKPGNPFVSFYISSNDYEFTMTVYNGLLKLKQYANSKGITIVGDIPIFVSMDSSDVWSNPDLFYLDSEGHPTVVAGVPPDYFSPTGQLWGNPLYKWPEHEKTDFDWWVQRIKATLLTADLIR